MPRLYSLRPEVAGGWGPRTVVANRAQIESGVAGVPEVAYLHYEFEDWLGDELLEAWPCYIITERLAADLSGRDLTGVRLGPVEASVSALFQDIHGDRRLPVFVRLMPEGKASLGDGGEVLGWSGHDACLSETGRLVVTERFLDTLRRHQFHHCEISDLGEAPPAA